MKTTIISKSIIFLVTASLLAFTPPTSKNAIKIKSGELNIGKVSFNFPWKLKDFEKALGHADRIDPGYNNIHTYDKKGIILYENPVSGYISDFNVYFGKDPDENQEFLPKDYFNGSFTVEGFKITKKTSLEELRKELTKYQFEKSIIGAWRGEYKNLYLYVQYNEDESEIYWISVGKKS